MQHLKKLLQFALFAAALIFTTPQQAIAGGGHQSNGFFSFGFGFPVSISSHSRHHGHGYIHYEEPRRRFHHRPYYRSYYNPRPRYHRHHRKARKRAYHRGFEEGRRYGKHQAKQRHHNRNKRFHDSNHNSVARTIIKKRVIRPAGDHYRGKGHRHHRDHYARNRY